MDFTASKLYLDKPDFKRITELQVRGEWCRDRYNMRGRMLKLGGWYMVVY